MCLAHHLISHDAQHRAWHRAGAETDREGETMDISLFDALQRLDLVQFKGMKDWYSLLLCHGSL